MIIGIVICAALCCFAGIRFRPSLKIIALMRHHSSGELVLGLSHSLRDQRRGPIEARRYFSRSAQTWIAASCGRTAARLGCARNRQHPLKANSLERW